TKLSLARPKEIVDSYVAAGLPGIQLRSPSGWRKGDVTAEEFVPFYRGALDHILEVNKRRIFYEQTARALLTRILTDAVPGDPNLRSPSGAGVGQLAYDFDGSIYTCDEGLALARAGDDAF